MDSSARALAAPATDRLGTFAAGLVWLLIVLMIVPEGFDYTLLTGHNPESGSAVSRLLWLVLLFGAMGVLLWRGMLGWLVVKQLNPFLLAFVALAFLSVAWSIEPIVTVRRDVRLITMVLVALAFAVTGMHARRLQNVVRPILTVMLTGSLLFGFFAPQFAIHQEVSPELVGAWRGLTNHKNSLGALAGVTLIFWLQGWSAREVRASRAVAFSVLAIACIWLSRSATALIATVFAVAFLGLLTRWPRTLQPYLKYAVILVVTALTVYALAVLRIIPGQGILLAPITAVTGDVTFTGRSEIWTILSEHIARHPWLGTGYGAYWTGPDPQSPSYTFVMRMGGFYPGTAHNGYLEVANDLGWIGLVCLLGYIGFHLRQTLQLLPFDKPQAVLFLTLFIHQAIANLSESHWLSVLSVQFVLMTLVSAVLARLLLEHRWRARTQAAQFAAGMSAPALQVPGSA